MKKLVYVGFAYPHHRSTHAGYNRIKDFLNYDYVVDCDKELAFWNSEQKNFVIKGVRWICRKLLHGGFPFAIIRCILLSVFHRNLVFHFIYPELFNDKLGWLRKFAFSNKMVCTIHQPFEILSKHDLDSQIAPCADALILMSRGDLVAIRDRYGKDKVEYIPHGTDMDFYKPDDSIGKKEQICMVGSWLRDYKLANEVFTELYEKHPQLKIKVVGSKEHFGELPYFVDKLSGIDDDALLNIYRESKCVFLPMYSFTANNAVLEATSSGCQVVISCNKADKSYFTDDNIWYTHQNKQDAVETIERVVYGGEMKDTAATIAKNREIYEWGNIARRTAEFLRSV